MAICILCKNKDPSPWAEALSRLDPLLDIRVWPDCGKPADIDMALTWQHPTGSLKHFPNLRLISSMGAGIDHIVQDDDLPGNIPIVRIVDPNLVEGMLDYLLMVLTQYRHHTEFYQEQSAKKAWSPRITLPTSDVNVAVLGLGAIGGSVAKGIAGAGYPVAGWSRKQKQIAGVHCFSGIDGLSTMLRESRALINLLPLTRETENLLNHELLAQLVPGAVLINVGRGAHLVDQDLIELLEQGHIAEAWLDVFREEPLHASDELWNHSRIKVTPHISSLTNPESAAAQVIENYRRLHAGESLLNQADLKRGY